MVVDRGYYYDATLEERERFQAEQGDFDPDQYKLFRKVCDNLTK